MELEYRLVRRETAAAADAFFVPSASTADLLAVCGAVGAPWPAVYRVVGGFLVVLAEPLSRPVPRAIGVRRMAGDLYVLTHANLLPALRPDEAVGLTRSRGLVFLPCSPPLAFDPSTPLREADLLRYDAVRRAEWESFPEPPTLADRLTVIQAESPPGIASEILAAGQPGGTAHLRPGPDDESDTPVPEDARPPAGTTAKRIVANTRFTLGQFLNYLGRTLGIGAMARVGADLARRAIEQVPRLSEKVLGDQEAAIRELLRQFQAGDVEQALRRAPIAVADPDAPRGRVDTGSQLNDHGGRYSLRNLLASGGSGGVAWFGGGDVWSQLAAEYHRLAEAAIRRGDVRRAAYLYGVLLRDPRQAARVLDAGGLHRDAAVLYRDKLHDPAAAAGCFERGGMWDEAIELYQQLEQFEAAADVYRRIGDEESALAMYWRAADRLKQRGQYVAAGDLLRNKAGQTDRAIGIFAQGWAAGGPDTLGCGLRLLDHHAIAGRWADLLSLAIEAVKKFPPPNAISAGQFFGELMKRTDPPIPEDVRAELRDHARLTLAEHLRHHALTSRNPGQVVSAAFGQTGAWPGPVVHDAAVALKHSLRPEPAQRASVRGVFRLVPGPVTAAAIARNTSDIVVASACGRIIVYQGEIHGTTFVAEASPRQPVALATDGTSRQVVVLSTGGGKVWLESFAERPGSGYESRQPCAVADETEGLPYLQPEIDHNGTVRVHTASADRVFAGVAILPVQHITSRADLDPYHFAVSATSGRWWWQGDIIGFNRWATANQTIMTSERTIGTVVVAWRPAISPQSTMRVAPVDWLRPRSDVLELVGVTELLAVRWNEVRLEGDGLELDSATGLCPAGFRVACLLGPGLIAAVDATNTVHYLKVDRGKLRASHPPRRVDYLAAAVFLADRPQSHEVLVVFADGFALRVPKP